MKIFISADIEGVTGVTHWDETDIEKSVSAAACEQMTAEVVAACKAALEHGADEILVKDAHDSGRNIIAAKLPHEARLIRGWEPHPFMMIQGLDETFQAVAFIGYHSRAGADTSPLAHTMTGSVMRITVNGRDASEFLLNTYTASMLKVPVIFVSGDKGLCEEVMELNSNIGTVAVKEGVGNSTISIHPDLAAIQIKEGMAKAIKSNPSKCLVTLPEHFSVDVQYKSHTKARVNSFYPGATQKDPHTVHYEHADYYEVLRFLYFATAG
jgi:D-amino peptidase